MLKQALQRRQEEVQQLELALEERGVKKPQIVTATPAAATPVDVTVKKTQSMNASLTMRVFDTVIDYMRDEVKKEMAS